MNTPVRNRLQSELTLPETYHSALETLLEPLGYSLQKPKPLAAAIVRLSDHYQNPQRVSPWNESWAQAAYLAYYVPLNWIRLKAVLAHAQDLGFLQGLSHVCDFGAGPGTARLAWEDLSLPMPKHWLSVDSSTHAHRLGQQLFQHLGKFAPPTATAPPIELSANHLGLFSYALNELPKFPEWALTARALLLVEPSQQDVARRLQALRPHLLQNGFSLWAPCTHENACPLLSESKSDWCHDRVHFLAPEWFAALENHLPMRNATLTFSYLLARRDPAPAGLAKLARLVGDQLREKGKTRQLVCRGSAREFLVWLTRHGEAPSLPRGALVALPAYLEAKGSELRVTPETPGVERIENFQVFNSTQP